MTTRPTAPMPSVSAAGDLPETVVPQGVRDGGVRGLFIFEASGSRSLPLPPGARVTIGRAPECDVVLQSPSVSRRHASIEVGTGITIHDLGSANGTVVGATRLASGASSEVKPGEIILVGDTTLVIAPYANAPQQTDRSVAPVKRGSADPNVVSADPKMEALFQLVDRVAPLPLPVLVLGETGTGKEVIASALHTRSARAKAPLVRVNCAAIAPNLLESELFGYEQGAFTGATRSKAGLLEAAGEGSIFLDEVGELPAVLQAKLLRALESNEYMRVGGVKPLTVRARFILATNRDLEAGVRSGEVRADFLHRINAITLTIPPLRERPGDILPLARFFMKKASTELGLPEKRLTAAGEAALQAHAWPGNVRELRNCLYRALALAPADALGPEHLGLSSATATPVALIAPGATPVAPIAVAPTAPSGPVAGGDSDERARILAALAQCAGNQSRAAVLLGISRRTLLRRLDQYQIARPRGGEDDPDSDAGAPDQ